MEKFIKSKVFAAQNKLVWERGEGEDYAAIHAPYDRVAAPGKWLLYITLPEHPGVKWLAFRSYQAARRYANKKLSSN